LPCSPSPRRGHLRGAAHSHRFGHRAPGGGRRSVAQASLEFERVFRKASSAIVAGVVRPVPTGRTGGGAAPRAGAQQDPERRGAQCSRFAPPLGLAASFRRGSRAYAAFRQCTTLFHRAGLVGDHYLGVALDLKVNSPPSGTVPWRRSMPWCCPSSSRRGIHRDSASRQSVARRVAGAVRPAPRHANSCVVRAVPGHTRGVVYRSWRALAAIVLTLGAVVAMAVGLADPVGGRTRSSRPSLAAHGHGHDDRNSRLHSFALHGTGRRADADTSTRPARWPTNFCPVPHPCSAPPSLRRLAVSEIRPVREMGLWTRVD